MAWAGSPGRRTGSTLPAAGWPAADGEAAVVYWCFHCYAVNDHPRGPCLACGQPVEPPLMLREVARQALAGPQSHEAERALHHTQWRVWEELALEQLASTAGLRRTPLLPGSEVIQLVTWNGEHIGHVRLDTSQPASERWVAVALKQGRLGGWYASAEAAASELARACGKDHGLGL